MAKIDADTNSSSSSSVPNPNPSSINADRRPQLRKSPTISDRGATPPPLDSPLFGGPLRPAVRRLTVSVDDPSDSPSVGGILDRDWCYPSFLGGGSVSSRPRPAVKPSGLPPPRAAAAKKRTDFSSLADVLRPPNRGKEKVERDQRVVSSSSDARAAKGISRRADSSLIFVVVS